MCVLAVVCYSYEDHPRLLSFGVSHAPHHKLPPVHKPLATTSKCLYTVSLFRCEVNNLFSFSATYLSWNMYNRIIIQDWIIIVQYLYQFYKPQHFIPATVNVQCWYMLLGDILWCRITRHSCGGGTHPLTISWGRSLHHQATHEGRSSGCNQKVDALPSG